MNRLIALNICIVVFTLSLAVQLSYQQLRCVGKGDPHITSFMGVGYESYQVYQASLVKNARLGYQVMASMFNTWNPDPFQTPTIASGFAINYMGTTFSCLMNGRCSVDGKYSPFLSQITDWRMVDPKLPGLQFARFTETMIGFRVYETKYADGTSGPILREVTTRSPRDIPPGRLKPRDSQPSFIEASALISNVVSREARRGSLTTSEGGVNYVVTNSTYDFKATSYTFNLDYHPTLGWTEGMCGNIEGIVSAFVDKLRGKTYFLRDGHAIEVVNAFRVPQSQSFFEPGAREENNWTKYEREELEYLMNNPVVARFNYDNKTQELATNFCEKKLGLSRYSQSGRGCIVDFLIGGVPPSLIQYYLLHNTGLGVSSAGEEALQKVARLIDDMISRTDRTLDTSTTLTTTERTNLTKSKLKLDVLKRRLMQNYVAEVSDASVIDAKITDSDRTFINQILEELNRVKLDIASKPATQENTDLLALIDYVVGHIKAAVAV